MNFLKKNTLLNLLLMFSLTGFAQKQTFDVISYTPPRGWEQQQLDGGIHLSASDKKTGGYVIALITKSIISGAPANENFNSRWESLVKTAVSITGEPEMSEPVQNNGWDIVSGGANYTDGAGKGIVTLLNATGYGHTVSVVLMTNTRQYQEELLQLINSLELSKPAQTETNNSVSADVANPSSIVGLWVDYKTESSGYINGFPMLTGGYFRREYVFNADGSYVFRAKDWSTLMKEILFVYETGTWTVKGNQLTITPKQGKGGWWSKAASGRTTEWGSLRKTSSYQLEKITYTFELKYFSGVKETHLILYNSMPTERDGGSNSNNQPNSWSYSPRALDKSLIDNPPGLKISVGPSASASATQANAIQSGNAANYPLAGKIWEGSTPEKFTGAGTMTGYNTGGFFTYQYKFNTDRTYRFVYVGASAYTDPNMLQYETGTYSVNGNQLTITPASGVNEEWSVAGGPVKLAGMSDVQIRKIKQSWGKRLKSGNRNLEKITYAFRIEYMQGNKANALILEGYNGHTEREGKGDIAYYFETPKERSVKLPRAVQ